MALSRDLYLRRVDSSESLPLPTFHRYIEIYDTDFFANLTESDREILLAQLEADSENDIYAPTVDDIQKVHPHELTPFGDFILDENYFHVGDQSVLFDIVGRPDLLIKYQTNCEEVDSFDSLLHPLIPDYWYMRESFMLGLSPEPLFLSPPALFENLYGFANDRKYIFKMGNVNAVDCAMNKGVVRYMIMRKLRGMSLHQYRQRFPHSIIPMDIAAQITRTVIHGLERLHNEARIVHGDIHSGNILLEQSSIVGQLRLQFVDFGRAFRDKRNLTNDRVTGIGQWNHWLCSPWQLDGRVWGRRDDVYKAIHIFAMLINPLEYAARENLQT